jgi:hypothetical protein
MDLLTLRKRKTWASYAIRILQKFTHTASLKCSKFKSFGARPNITGTQSPYHIMQSWVGQRFTGIATEHQIHKHDM